jgi:hypothetical protein
MRHINPQNPSRPAGQLHPLASVFAGWSVVAPNQSKGQITGAAADGLNLSALLAGSR